MIVNDRGTVTGRKKTPEGYLQVTAKIARVGVQRYHNVADDKGVTRQTVDVYRPPEEVFSPDSMRSFEMRPVTNDHPPVIVDSTNVNKYSVGTSFGEVTRDGDHLVANLLITHADVIKAIDDGKEEISNGYTADLEWKSGTTPQGEAYDAIQRNIRGNHIAIVDAGRCGGSCRVDDSKAPCSCGGHEVVDISLKTITIDGIPVQTTDAGAAVIDNLQRSLAKVTTDLTDARAKLTDAEKDTKTKLDAKQAELDVLKAQTTDEALDLRVSERVAVITKGKLILGDSFDPKGKTNAAIRQEAVTKVLTADRVAGKDEAYFTVAFDVLDAPTPSAAPHTDPFRKKVIDGMTDAKDPYQAYVDSLESGYSLVPQTQEA